MFPRAARGVCGGSPPANARHAQPAPRLALPSFPSVSVRCRVSGLRTLGALGNPVPHDPPGLTPGFPNSDETNGRYRSLFFYRSGMTAEVRREFSVQSGTGRDLSLRRLSKPSVVALDSRIAMKNIVATLLIFLSFGNDGRGEAGIQRPIGDRSRPVPTPAAAEPDETGYLPLLPANGHNTDPAPKSVPNPATISIAPRPPSNHPVFGGQVATTCKRA